jgi:hypothetical protein
VVDLGERFDELVESFTSGSRAVRDARARIRHIVVIEVERALPLVSPAYDEDVSEEEVSLAGSGISRNCGRLVGGRDVAPATRAVVDRPERGAPAPPAGRATGAKVIRRA